MTSHAPLGSSGRKTGFWLEDFAAPYYVFEDAGAATTLASAAGGQPPLDPKSDEPGSATDSTRRFETDRAAQAALAATVKLHGVVAADYDAVFYPGGHGPLWDPADDPQLIALIEATDAAGKPIAAVRHAPGVLRHVKSPDGEPLVNGRRVTGSSNSEERAVGWSAVGPLFGRRHAACAG
jgi:putative intracellular protease/amidase